MDAFDTKALKPMLISEMKNAFNSPEWIYETKFDGIRCLAYLDGSSTDLRNKRDKKLVPHLPELSEIHKQVKEKCILDGEVFVLKDGITDFYEVQRRALLNDPFKIEISSKKFPATFVAFDIIYYKDHLVNDLPLIQRKNLINKVIIEENNFISISRYIENDGIALFEAAKLRNLEGIVAKKKESKYYFDKRTKDWVKCKVMSTEDCIICGYILKANNMTSMVLGQYDKSKLIYRGHVTLGASLRNLNQYKYKIINESPFENTPPGNEGAVWIEPELVCIVESMPTDKDSFRQPVFKGIRDDKSAEECVLKENIIS